jgi:uroporphyrinogen-III synthase
METTTPENPASRLEIVHRISSIVSSDRSLDEMLGEIIGLTVQVTSCDACLVYLIERDTGEIVLWASQVPHVGDLGILRMRIGEGITGWVAEHKSVVVLARNAFSDTRFKRFPGLVEDTYEALTSVPLVSGGDVIGIINIHHRESHQPSISEVTTLTFVGEQMGLAVAKARLAEETENMKRQLETRKLLERAKGILQRTMQLTEEEAYLHLRNESRRLRKPMRELAEAIILTEDLVRKHAAGSDASAPTFTGSQS